MVKRRLQREWLRLAEQQFAGLEHAEAAVWAALFMTVWED